MARLKCHGDELARVSLERVIDNERDVNWERTTRTLHSDGTLLEKVDVRFKPDQYQPEGRRHTWGWKVRGKVKPGLMAEAFAEMYRAKGWTVELPTAPVAPPAHEWVH